MISTIENVHGKSGVVAGAVPPQSITVEGELARLQARAEELESAADRATSVESLTHLGELRSGCWKAIGRLSLGKFRH